MNTFDEVFHSDEMRLMRLMGDICNPKYMESEDGELFQVADAGAFYTFRNIWEGKTSFQFKKKDFDNDADIQEHLKCLGIDNNQFWYALLVLDSIADQMFTNGIKRRQTVREVLLSLKEELQSKDVAIEIKRDGKKAMTITDANAFSYLSDAIEKEVQFQDELEQAGEESLSFNWQVIVDSDKGIIQAKSAQIAFEARKLKEFFDVILGKSRKRSTNGSSAGDRLLFISRLMYFTMQTDNENYLVSTDSIKGVLKSYPKDNPAVMSRVL